MLRFGGAFTLISVIVYTVYNLEKVLLGRFWGAALTFLVLGVCAVLCVWQGIRGMAAP